MSELTSLKKFVEDYVLTGRKLPDHIAEELGLDIDTLVAVVADLKPHFDYLRGYQNIMDWFDQSDIIWGTQFTEAWIRAWHEYPGRWRAHEKVLLLFDGQVCSADGAPYVDKPFHIFMTRTGRWAYWTNVGAKTIVDSTLRIDLSLGALFTQMADDLQDGEFVAEISSWPRSQLTRGRLRNKNSVALTLAHNLIKKFEKSHKDKIDLLEPESEKIKSASLRLKPYDI